MKQALFVLLGRSVVIASCLAVLAGAGARAAHASLTGSPHDFSSTGPSTKTLGPNGACSACHLPHRVPGSNPNHLLLWRSTLTQEWNYFTYDGNRNSPNYVPGTTLLCYDCHDDNATTVSPAIDDEPSASAWANEPQDIAFGYAYESVSPFDLVPDDTLAQGGTKTGYSELLNGDVAGGPSPLPADGDPTGGHYWKSEPSGTPDYRRGDKIPCSLCHDPHNSASRTGSNEAFFLTSTSFAGGSSVSLGNGLTASNKDDTTNLNRSRNGTGTGREMCAACHSYSNSGSPVSFAGVTLPKPPTSLPQHRSTNTTPCTKCHPHNQVFTSCNLCHGFPPLETIAQAGGAFDPTDRPNAENYDGGAGAHQRHRDALGDAVFSCEICHGPDPGSATWHNQGAGSIPDGGNVDIMGQSAYWDPTSTRSNAKYTGTTSSETLPSGYEFKAKGGANQRCSDLACHGDPPDVDDALTWTSDMVDSDTTIPGDPVAAGDIRICKWCHDATPAVIDFGSGSIVAPNVLGDNDGTTSLWNTGTWGADVNGHGLVGTSKYDQNVLADALGKDGADKDCTICHDARYRDNGAPPPDNVPYRTHFDGLDNSPEKRLRGTGGTTINGLAAATYDDVCLNCHQNAGVESGTQVSTHGNDFEGNAEGARGSMSRACRQCHDVHGANWNNTTTPPRNLFMVGRWVDVDNDGVADAGEEARVDSTAVDATTDITGADLPVILARRGPPTTASADDSFDDGFNDAQHESVCVVCHKAADMNPIHLGENTVESTTVQGLGHNPVGTDCMACHDHDYDNAVATADAFAPSGCNGCHGTNTTEALQPGAIRGQYWPDGAATFPQYAYADNQPAAHLNHVASIGQQLYAETPALLVQDFTAGNPGLTSSEKQKTICAFCHPDPGGGGHSIDEATAPSGSGRVDVFGGTAAGDWFRKYVPDPGVRAVAADDTTATPPNGYDYTTLSCANLVCHNQAPTPKSTDVAPLLPGTWDAPPDWSAPNADCSNTTCHATGTYTNMHAVHVGDAQKNYACTECHADNYSPVNLGHGNGEVDMVWNNAGAIEFVQGGGNGFYDKDGSGGAVPSAGDTAFAYKNLNYVITCNRIYCHGGDNDATYAPDWGGSFTAPVWNNADSAYCGSCHDGNGTGPLPAGDASVVTSGNHTDHLSAAYGPRFALPAGIGPGTAADSCLGGATTGCHTDFQITTATHVNGTTEFANLDTTTTSVSALGSTAPAGAPDATSTDRCNSCHSTASVTVNIPGPTTVSDTGTALAKTNWANGTYTLPCLTCHNGTDPATVYADGTGAVTAPDMLGDDTNFGAEIRGHNRALADGNYPVSGNPAAARECTACHDAASAHINDVDDTTYDGNRMLATVNGDPATSVTMACNNCHATAAASPAVKKGINMHGNSGFPISPTRRLEEEFPTTGTYAMECTYCHEAHGRTANGAGYNIYMVPSTITVPGLAAVITAPGVRFEAKTGDYSFNDTLGTDADDLCVVCHTLNGNSMSYNDGGYHSAPEYDNDEEGSDCSGCHLHNRDDSLATVDGLMTVACNTCHTFPGLNSLAAVPPATQAPHRLSASHDKHVGKPGDEVPPPFPNKGFVCNACHFQSSHNNSGMQPTGTWPAGDIGPNVQVRFADPAATPTPPQLAGPWNTATVPNPADRTQDSASFDETSNVCSNLYCHGDDPGTFPAADAGSNTTPDWDLPATGACGTCHNYTAATPPGSLAHPKHAGTGALPADPEYSIGCQVCHYATTTNGTTIVSMVPHVNNSADVVFNALADPRVDATSSYAGDAAVGSGYGDCTATYCHSNGTDRVAPYDTAGTAPPAVALTWDAGSTCWSCHGDGLAIARPAYDDGDPKANKHQIHNALPTDTPPGNNYGCPVCHWPTTQAADEIVSTVLHVNRSYEANDDEAGSALDAFDFVPGAVGVPGTCDTANCHGGNSGISWGLAGPIACDICHSYVAGALTATDVNNFVWDGTTQSKIGNAAGGEYETAGHGKAGVVQVCGDCHDSAVGHDPTMAGANPYRLVGYAGDQTAFCNATCHAVQVRTHDPDEMALAGIPPKRTPWPAPWNTPATSPRCVNCHDPHGDAANLSMVQRELYDKAPFRLDAAAPADPTEQPNLVFTDNTTGIDASAPYTSYADDGAFSSICQECHEAANMVSFHDGPSGGTVAGANHPSAGTNPGDCSNCHRHEAGFAPSGCEGCHNINSTYPLAPNVMGDGIDEDGAPGSDPKPYDDGLWGYNVNGHGANGTAANTPLEEVFPGVFQPYLTPDLECDACHELQSHHFDGTLNTAANRGNAAVNSYHLKTDGAYPFIPASAPSDYSLQVAFDMACTLRCHRNGSMGNPALAMFHAKDADPAPGAVRFGDHGTTTSLAGFPYPYDVDVSTLGTAGGDDFIPCVTCHAPHGTDIAESTKLSNRMLRANWVTPSTLCLVCH